jgi:hypothetical protein
VQPFWIPDTNLPPEVASALIAQCASLLRRIIAVESALDTREWWLLGRAVPEAGQISEAASLLAVARGELEQALDAQFGWRMPAPQADMLEQEGDSQALTPDLALDPALTQARRNEANGLLRMLGQNLPAMRSFAAQLRANAGDAGLPSATLGALSIVSDRLGESIETIRQSES